MKMLYYPVIRIVFIKTMISYYFPIWSKSNKDDTDLTGFHGFFNPCTSVKSVLLTIVFLKEHMGQI